MCDMVTLPPVYLSAMSFRDKIAKRYDEFYQSGNTDMVAAKDIRQSVPPGLYEHFKSRPDDCKFYIVTGAGFQQTTFEPTVYYTSMYGSNAGYPTDRRLFHEEDGFLTPVIRERVYIGSRFTLIMELDALQRGTLIYSMDALSGIKNAEEFKLCVREILNG